MAVSPTTPPRSPLTPGREILFESYLQKTPPLDKLFVVRQRERESIIVQSQYCQHSYYNIYIYIYYNHNRCYHYMNLLQDHL